MFNNLTLIKMMNPFKIEFKIQNSKLFTAFALCILQFAFLNTNAQNKLKVGQNPSIINSSAVLEIEHTTKGVLFPRMNTTAVNAIPSPAKGLMVMDTTVNCLKRFDGVSWDCVGTPGTSCNGKKIKGSTAQSYTGSGTYTALNTTEFTKGDIASNSNRITFNIAGYYLVGAIASFADVNSAANVGTKIVKNGTTVIAREEYKNVSSSDYSWFAPSDVVYMNVGDYVQVMCYTDMPGNSISIADVTLSAMQQGCGTGRDTIVSVGGSGANTASPLSGNGTAGNPVTMTAPNFATFAAQSPIKDSMVSFVNQAINTGVGITGKNATAGSLVIVTGGTGATLKNMTVAVNTAALKDTIAKYVTSNTNLRDSITSLINTVIKDSTKINGKDLTATNNLISITNGIGTTLLNTSVKVNQSNFRLDSIGGTLTPAKIAASGTNGQVLTTVAGVTSWANAGSGADNWGTQTAVARSPLMGNGTAASPLALDSSALAKQLATAPMKDSIISVINTGITAGSVNGKDYTATNNALTITGGTATTLKTTTIALNQSNIKLDSLTGLLAPAKIAASGTNGQVLTTVAGVTSWANAGSGADNWGTQTAVARSPLMGNGSAASPLALDSSALAKQLSTAPMKDSIISVVNTGITAGSVNGKDYTATNNALTITGGTATSLKTTTIALNQSNIKLDSLTGLLAPAKITASGTNGQVLTTVGGVTSWANAGSGADNWGTQTIATSGTLLSGNGTSGSPLTVTPAALAVNLSPSPVRDSIIAIAATKEPWFNQATNTGATSNTQNIYQMGNVGLNTTTPNSSLQVNGSFSSAITSKTAAYTATVSDHKIIVNGTFNLTLPTAVGIAGREYQVKNTGTGTVTIVTTGGQTIDGVATIPLDAQWTVRTFVSDGANWFIFNNQ
jgi:hypothetical protein